MRKTLWLAAVLALLLSLPGGLAGGAGGPPPLPCRRISAR